METTQPQLKSQLKEQVVKLPEPSVTLKELVVLPCGNTEPLSNPPVC